MKKRNELWKRTAKTDKKERYECTIIIIKVKEHPNNIIKELKQLNESNKLDLNKLKESDKNLQNQIKDLDKTIHDKVSEISVLTTDNNNFQKMIEALQK